MQLKEGDKVRVLKKKGLFDKSVPSFSSRVYEVDHVNGYKVYLADEGVRVDKSYKYWQLQKVDDVNSFEPPEINKSIPISKAKKKHKFKSVQKKEELGKVSDTGDIELHRSLQPVSEKRQIKVPSRFRN
jgi:hypothetical protein